jgi:hypothetical protein
MKHLIALVAIAAAAYVPDQPAFAAGEKFEAPDDIADLMLRDKVTELVPAGDGKTTTKAAKRAKVRLLVDSALGNCNDVVEVDAGDVKKLESDNLADGGKEAVAYAMTLEQNKA